MTTKTGVCLNKKLWGFLILGFSWLWGTAFAAPPSPLLLTDTYPLAIAALNLTAQTSWQTNMVVDHQAGCPQHYQLKAQDWARLDNANLLVVNGLGLDGFLPAVKTKFKILPVIELDRHLNLLKDAYLVLDKDVKGKGQTPAGVNPHVWLSVKNMISQVKQLRKVLAKRSNAADHKQIKRNAVAYAAQLKILAKEVKGLRKNLAKRFLAKQNSRKALVLSDALAYLAHDLGWQPVVWSKEEETGLSPREMAALIKVMQVEQISLIVAEDAQAKTAQTLADATKAQVVLGSSILQGPWEKDGYVHLMRQNLARFQELLDK